MDVRSRVGELRAKTALGSCHRLGVTARVVVGPTQPPPGTGRLGVDLGHSGVASDVVVVVRGGTPAHDCQRDHDKKDHRPRKPEAGGGPREPASMNGGEKRRRRPEETDVGEVRVAFREHGVSRRQKWQSAAHCRHEPERGQSADSRPSQ